MSKYLDEVTGMISVKSYDEATELNNSLKYNHIRIFSLGKVLYSGTTLEEVMEYARERCPGILVESFEFRNMGLYKKQYLHLLDD